MYIRKWQYTWKETDQATKQVNQAGEKIVTLMVVLLIISVQSEKIRFVQGSDAAVERIWRAALPYTPSIHQIVKEI